MITHNVSDVRDHLKTLYRLGDKANNDTYEIVNAAFIADEPSIFGTVNSEYAECEVEWYNSMSLDVFDMSCKTPKIWEQVSSKHGMINSNYGWCIFSKENFYQYQEAINCLAEDIGSRQSAMIYIRPTMHKDAFVDGMKDFMCTYAVQLMIRNGKLNYIVYMRSNDAVFGYKNDKYWHDVVFNKALDELKGMYPNLTKGNMYWNAASLHVYPRHFHLLED
jgi:thymidylate synthase